MFGKKIGLYLGDIATEKVIEDASIGERCKGAGKCCEGNEMTKRKERIEDDARRGVMSGNEDDVRRGLRTRKRLQEM